MSLFRVRSSLWRCLHSVLHDIVPFERSESVSYLVCFSLLLHQINNDKRTHTDSNKISVSRDVSSSSFIVEGWALEMISTEAMDPRIQSWHNQRSVEKEGCFLSTRKTMCCKITGCCAVKQQQVLVVGWLEGGQGALSFPQPLTLSLCIPKFIKNK